MDPWLSCSVKKHALPLACKYTSIRDLWPDLIVLWLSSATWHLYDRVAKQERISLNNLPENVWTGINDVKYSPGVKPWEYMKRILVTVVKY